MSTVLVTGATGALGRPTVAALRDAGHDVRAQSRHPWTPERQTWLGGAAGGIAGVVADIATGQGLEQAVRGVDVVVHLASTSRDDAPLARQLCAATLRAGVGHLVLMSIVGIDEVPLPFYRSKVAVEGIVAASGQPHTVLRSTQFHSLVERLFTVQQASPVLFAPAFRVQPIAEADVAARLGQLVAGPAVGRVPDIGGPQVAQGVELARTWLRVRRSRRLVVPLRLPGKAFAAYRAGHHLVPPPAFGAATFEDHVAAGTQKAL